MANPLRVAITLDIDPDANRPVPGRVDAVSPPIEAGLARFDAVHDGFRSTLDILASLSIPATLFFESRTARELVKRGLDLPALCRGHEIACHGREHEDLLGTESGLPLSQAQMHDVLSESVAEIEQATGSRPTGFRAPYTRVNDTALAVLADLGFAYDSSITRRVGPNWPMAPYAAAQALNSLWEIPLPSFRDNRGKRMSCYLWPLFEGRREAAEYIDIATQCAQRFPGGISQLALHPWHIFIDEEGRPVTSSQASRNRDGLTEILNQVSQLEGVEMKALDACLH